jgi:hypothetical protein
VTSKFCSEMAVYVWVYLQGIINLCGKSRFYVRQQEILLIKTVLSGLPWRAVPGYSSPLQHVVTIYNFCYKNIWGADKSLALPTFLSIFFSSPGNRCSPTGRTIGWVIKKLEAQVGQFLLGCKCPVAYFHFIHAFGNGRRKYASKPIAKRTVRRIKKNHRHHVDFM